MSTFVASFSKVLWFDRVIWYNQRTDPKVIHYFTFFAEPFWLICSARDDVHTSKTIFWFFSNWESFVRSSRKNWQHDRFVIQFEDRCFYCPKNHWAKKLLHEMQRKFSTFLGGDWEGRVESHNSDLLLGFQGRMHLKTQMRWYNYQSN